MITDHTEPAEAWRQMAQDIPGILHFYGKSKKRIMKRAKNATEYPLFEVVDYTPPATNNTYKLFFKTYLDGDYICMDGGHYLPVQQNNGCRIWLYIPENDGEEEKTAILWVINPHFLSRYRERTAFPGVDNMSEMLADVYDNLPVLPMTFNNRAGINRNFFLYDGNVDGEKCSGYLPMINGVAFIRKTVAPNTVSQVPRDINIIELCTFVDVSRLTDQQLVEIRNDIIDAMAKVREGDPDIPVPDECSPFTDSLAKVKGHFAEQQHKGRAERENRKKETLVKMQDFVSKTIEKYGIVIDENEFEAEPYDLSVPEEMLYPNRAFRRGMEKYVRKHASRKKPNPLTPVVRTFTDDEVEAILKSRADGITIARLAATYRTGTDRIRKVIQENKARFDALVEEKKSLTLIKDNTMSKQRTNFPKKDVEEMLRLNKEGKTFGEISRKFSTSPSVIYDVLFPYLNKEKDEKAEEQKDAEKISLTREQIDGILQQVAEGTEYSVIAARYDITVRDVTAVVDANGSYLATLIVANGDEEKATADGPVSDKTPKPDRPKTSVRGPVTGEDREEILGLAAEGLSIKDIAELVHRKPKTIEQILNAKQTKESAPPKEASFKGTIPEETINRILSLREKGYGSDRIAALVKHSSSTVYNILLIKGDPLGKIGNKGISQKPKTVKETSVKPQKSAAAGAAKTAGDEAPSWTEKDILSMYKMREDGLAVHEIATRCGISESVLSVMLPDKAPESALPAKEKPEQRAKTGGVTLDDFQDRDIIRHLYAKGYRIEGQQLVIRHEDKVLETDEEIMRLRQLGYNIVTDGMTRTKTETVNLEEFLKGLMPEND